MKKIILALVVLIIAAPALARVDITCEQADGEPNVTVSYANGEAEPVRAFALEITLDAGEISAISCLSSEYYIYPGSIQIDNGEVVDFGDCVASGIDSNQVVVEMGSLYADNDPCHTTPPPDDDDLLLVTVTEACTMCITENQLRGGVVMETPSATPDVNAPCCEVEMGCECWGDISGGAGVPDGQVSTSDLGLLLSTLGPVGSPYVLCPVPEGLECMDIAGPAGCPDGCLSTSDLGALLGYLGPFGSPYVGPCMPDPPPCP
jgi:hypothetical protein